MADLKISQQLVMTPQLTMAIQLLQKPLDEIIGFLTAQTKVVHTEQRFERSNAGPPDRHWRIPFVPARDVAVERRSLHVTARDGTRIAVDVCIAREHLGKKLPVIVRQTRYYRGIDVRRAFRNTRVTELPDNHANTRRLFLAAGYAWVDMDVRGSGASFGTQIVPWSDDEVRDGYDVVDWIVRQPWSSGRVGALGISYDGTSAERLGYAGHPAVRAVAPTFSLFDVFADVAFPGGVHLSGFTDAWSRFNRTLDDGRFTTAMAHGMWHIIRSALPSDSSGSRFAPLARALTVDRFASVVAPALDAMVLGVRAVEGDTDRALIARAAREHERNVDVHAGALRLIHRDDLGLSESYPEMSIEDFSPHRKFQGAPDDVAIYSISGWRDGAYQRAATHRLTNVNTKRSKLLLGPWCHGGRLYASPDHAMRPTAFDIDRELLRWFDLHLADRDDGVSEEPPVHFYVTGEERWQNAASWPPPSDTMHTFHAAHGRTLSSTAPTGETGSDAVRVDTTHGAGHGTRWNTLLGGFIRGDHPDRRAHDATLLTYTSEPLASPLAFAGHGRVHLWLETDAGDLAFHVYLEEVAPDGSVHHVTEGVLRATHRAHGGRGPYVTHAPWRSHERRDGEALPANTPVLVEVELLPTAHVFRSGRCVRLAVATSDRDHFATVSTEGARLRVLRDRAHATRIELPGYTLTR